MCSEPKDETPKRGRAKRPEVMTNTTDGESRQERKKKRKKKKKKKKKKIR
jgi:hypothetical protein